MAKPKRNTKVIATYNIKGGVGKTSAAVNLAYLASQAGHPTLIWDLDPQAASTYLFRVRPKVEGGGRGLLRADYDYIFLACPPSISLVSEAVFEASDALLVPVIPATLSSRAYEQLEELARGGKVGRKGKTSILA